MFACCLRVKLVCVVVRENAVRFALAAFGAQIMTLVSWSVAVVVPYNFSPACLWCCAALGALFADWRALARAKKQICFHAGKGLQFVRAFVIVIHGRLVLSPITDDD